DVESAEWLTGERLERQLQTHVTALRWVSNPLRAALGSLARSQHVAMFLDRRIDPDQTVDFTAQDEPLQELIVRFANSRHIGACRVGPVIYFGPPETTAVLSTVVELRRDELRRWPASVAARLKVSHPVSWAELAEPRDLIVQAARQAGLEVTGLELVPHDLWPAANLPPLDFAEHMSLLLAGFGLTFESVEGVLQIRLIPLPSSVAIERAYRVSARQAARIMELLQQRFPEAEVERRADGLSVRGPIEIHRTVDSWLRGESTTTAIRPPAKNAEVRYTLDIKNQPVGRIAEALAKRLGLRIQYDPRSRDKLSELVSFRVEEVTRDELLRALLAPAGLSFRIADETLEVFPATNNP
ncbi:MAG: hypothetical protein JJ992_19315, partial [Planctomycetes bacterium]|nr:hypothetical protein [Planctomycetota bacterium]